MHLLCVHACAQVHVSLRACIHLGDIVHTHVNVSMYLMQVCVGTMYMHVCVHVLWACACVHMWFVWVSEHVDMHV